MTRQTCILLASVLASLAASCSDIELTPEGYQKAVLSGLEKILEARQFDELFGKENVDHFIGYSGDRDDCRWTSDVYFGGRYGLSMQVKVRMGRSFDEVLEVVGEPEFVMVEFRKVEPAGGAQMARMASEFEEKYGHFGRSEWKRSTKPTGPSRRSGFRSKWMRRRSSI